MHIGANVIIKLHSINFHNNYVTVNLGLQLFIFGIFFMYCTLVLHSCFSISWLKGLQLLCLQKTERRYVCYKEYAYFRIFRFLVKMYESKYFVKSIWLQNVLISIVYYHLPKKNLSSQFSFTVLLSMKFTLLDSLFFMFVALKVKWLLSAYLSQEVQIKYSAVVTGVKI